jgi:hypothetical protein
MSKMTKRRGTTEKSLRIGDKELQDWLLAKATKTAAAQQKQEQRNHELYQAVFSKPKPDTSTLGTAAKDHARLAQLVIAYHVKFGRYVPARALRLLDAAAIIQDALDTGVLLSEIEWGRPSMEFSPRGCIMDRETPTKLPSGKWLH